MNKIQCRICGIKTVEYRIKRHLKDQHQIIDFNQYVKDNIEDFKYWPLCPICGIPTIKKSACSRGCMSEVKRINYTGKPHHKFTKEEKKKISEARKKQGSPWLVGKKLTKEHKKNIAKTRKERGCGIGKNNPMYGKTHTPEAIKKIFSHRKMNKLEQLVAKTLDDAGYEYTFQFFITDSGICKSYDFKIKGKPIIIEVDGDFWHGNSDTVPEDKQFKYVDQVQENDILKEQIAHNHGYSIHRYWGSEIKKNPKIVLDNMK